MRTAYCRVFVVYLVCQECKERPETPPFDSSGVHRNDFRSKRNLLSFAQRILFKFLAVNGVILDIDTVRLEEETLSGTRLFAWHKKNRDRIVIMLKTRTINGDLASALESITSATLEGLF